MGSLTIPDSGAIYLDANGFIYSVESIEPYAALLEPLWQAATQGQVRIASSELVIAETLVKPLREQDELLVQIFRELLLSTQEVELIPTTTEIWGKAAQLRAMFGLKTPDAVHAASALAAGTVLFVTNDPHFRRVDSLSVAILDELVSEGSAID